MKNNFSKKKKLISSNDLSAIQIFNAKASIELLDSYKFSNASILSSLSIQIFEYNSNFTIN